MCVTTVIDSDIEIVYFSRAYHSKLKPIKLSQVPEEERPAAESVSLFDIHQEMDWLLALINKLQCPVVFSHNDINTGNILVKDNYQGCDPVVLIDFEFSSYNYRSFDIANHFNEWMYDYRWEKTLAHLLCFTQFYRHLIKKVHFTPETDTHHYIINNV